MNPRMITRLREIIADPKTSASLKATATSSLQREGVSIVEPDLSLNAFVEKAKFDVRLDEIPVEKHKVNGSPLLVYRADEAAPKSAAPYIKCCLLPPFVKWAKQAGYKAIGYYANKESFWVGTLKKACDKVGGIRAIITVPDLKSPPDWLPDLGDAAVKLRPNMWHVNYNISRKLVEKEGGLMIPMGLDLPAFVQLQTKFFDDFPLPNAASYVVPTGSGTALSCALLHLQKRRMKREVHAVVTRSVDGVRRTVAGNVPDISALHLHALETDTELLGDDATFPVTKWWERTAYTWLHEHIAELPQPICFLNLGR